MRPDAAPRSGTFLPDFRFKNGKLVGVAEDTPRLNFNGPLIKDHLYLSQSAAYSIAKRPVRGLPFPVNETKTESQSYFSQIDTILSSHHTQTFTFGYFPERDQFVGLDFFTPQSVTPNYGQRDFSFSGRDHYELHKGLLESAFSFRRFDARVWGQGSEDQTFTPTIEQGNYFATSDRRSSRLELLEVYTAPPFEVLGGSHEVKGGFDLVVLTANPWSAFRLSVEMARAGGRISILGFPGRGEAPPDFNPLDPKWFYGKQLTLIGAGFAPRTIHTAPSYKIVGV